jgi:hypothetical protein
VGESPSCNEIENGKDGAYRPYLCDDEPNEPSPYRLTFGKHRGKALQEVSQTPGGSYYMGWMLKNDIARDCPDLKEALKVYQ